MIKSKQEIFNEDKIMLEVEYVAPLEKSVVERMTSGEMSLKEFSNIEKQISERLNYFMWKAAEIAGVTLSWWDYNNGDSESEADGHFDPKIYVDKVGIEGQYQGKSDNNMLFDDYFSDGLPMEVLYLDIEEKVNKDLKDLHESIELTKKEDLEKAKQKEQKDKDFKALVESIRSKLTPEELKIVKFVNKSKK